MIFLAPISVPPGSAMGGNTLATTADISGPLANAADYNIYASSQDGITLVYTTVQFKRPDTTLYVQSTLSNPDVNGNYQTVVVQYYAANGTTITQTLTWTIVYDAYSNILTKTFV